MTLLVAGCDSPAHPPTVNAVRGQYLVQAVLGCGDCHTTPQANGLPSFDPRDFLAGGREFDITVGAAMQKFYASNLTSDVATGLGGWSDEQVKRAIRQGIDNKGAALFPIMPYWSLGNMSDDDLTSILLFLRTLPAKVNHTLDDTFSLSTPVALLDKTKLPHTTLPATDAKFASAEHGRYLAAEMGACVHCHSPSGTSLEMPIDLSLAFAGGQIFPLGPITTISANLTPDATGLAGWTTDDLINTVRTDIEKGHGRPLCPPMPGGPNRDGDMTPEDLTDIANYLITLAPITHGPFGCTDGGVPYGLDGGQ